MARLLPMLLALGLTHTTEARKLVVSTYDFVQAFDFDGTSFTPSNNDTVAGTDFSWATFKEPNFLYVNDEESYSTRLFNYTADSNTITGPVSTALGSPGVVNFAFNVDKTRLLGASYSTGTVDVWDSSASDGSLKAHGNVTLEGPLNGTSPQDVHRAHQVLRDPSGRYYAVNDLGGDAVHIIDSKDDKFQVVRRVAVDSGYGPRHGAWVTLENTKDGIATHYALACELGSRLLLFKVWIDANGTIDLAKLHDQSTYGPGFPPANASTAAAGGVVLAPNQRDLYVSNRLSGNTTDSISHFVFGDGTGSNASLRFVGQQSSGGISPRMMSLTRDGEFMLLSNQLGTSGLVALPRDTEGLLGAAVATYPNSAFPVVTDAYPGADSGPQFLQEMVVS